MNEVALAPGLALPLAAGLDLPVEAATQKLAIVGRTGSGKSYTAQLVAESMWRAGIQFVALDPKGDWWGLRLGADGISPGYEIAIFGGLHGDVEASEDGVKVARAVVELGISAIVDLSGFDTDAATRKFAIAFARELYNLKKRAPSAIHLFLEEAEVFIPQQPQPGDAQVIHEFNRMAKLGRGFGIGMSIITQRPQDVSKKALSQSELLLAHQLTGSNERKAIEAWTSGQEGAEGIRDLLPRIEVGKPFAFSPQWLKLAGTIEVFARETFDAGATPKVGAAPVARTIASVDVEKLRQALGKGDDRDDDRRGDDRRGEDAGEISRLKAEVGRLTRERDEADAFVAHFETEWHRLLPTAARLAAIGEEAGKLADMIREVVAGNDVGQVPEAEYKPAPALPEIITAPVEPAGKTGAKINPPSDAGAWVDHIVSSGKSEISAPQRRILDVLATFEPIGLTTVRKDVVAFFAEASPSSSSYTNNLGRLRSLGLIDYPSGGFVALTEDGRAIATAAEIPRTLAEFQARWLAMISEPQAKIVRKLIECYPNPARKDLIAEHVGASVTSSSYTNNLGRLRTLKLIDYPVPGRVVATDLLFPEGLS